MMKQRPMGEAQRRTNHVRARKVKLPRIALPYSGYYAYAILALTVLIFLAQMLVGGWFTDSLVLSKSVLLTRPWTLVTSMFLHANVMHLFLNMLMLFFFGPVLERRIGSGNFLAVYFGSGILAGLVQVLLFSGGVLGASGALFGVMGALTVLAPNMTVILYIVPLKLVYVTILFAILDLYPVLFSVGDGIAHIAHLTGLVVGLAAGYYYKKTNRMREIRYQV
jgi:membrane associated rhomboid family serine protease